MIWALLTLLFLIAAGTALARRRRYDPADAEPWRASLEREDDELDMEEARLAEEAFLASEWDDADGDDDEHEPWRG